jgi:ABC-type transport system involved in multi-copper enzyme maturation permease subunit
MTVHASSPRWSSIAVVARFSLREQLWSLRTLSMLAISAAPLGLALVYRLLAALQVTGGTSGFDAFSAIVGGAFLPFIAPMLALFYASGVVADDVEAGTMPYFLIRPIGRPALLAGKVLATFSISLVLLLPFLTLTYYITLAPSGLREIGSRFPTLLQDLGAATLGLLAYNGIFALLGTVLRRPLLAGLFFIFGWQAVATFVPGSVRYLTVAHYLQSLTPHPPGGVLAALVSEPSSPAGSILALLAIATATHAVAIRVFSSKEVR